MRSEQKIYKMHIGEYKYDFYSVNEFLIGLLHTYVYKLHAIKLTNPKPLIIDCGSNIGVMVLYYKKQYPGSKIIAFEPDPFIFQLLKNNVRQNDLIGVELVNAALSKRKGKQHYYHTKAGRSGWGGSLKLNDWYVEKDGSITSVNTVRLSSYVKREVDLLKMDIEGSETEVLEELSDKISLVKNLDIEFHGSVKNPKNKYQKIIAILKKYGFDYTIEQGLTGFLRIKQVSEEKIKQTSPLYLSIYASKK